MNPDVSPRLERSSGTARISFKPRSSGTVLDDLYQEGCCKVRFPRKHDGLPEAILINTAGGLADGDTLTTRIECCSNTRAMVTTQAAERVYKAASNDVARVTTAISIGEDSMACWLPQESIVFDGARLHRSLDVDMTPTSRLFALESTVFGRRAMGETVKRGRVSDRWRVRIDGRLAFADNFLVDDQLTGNIDEYLDQAAVANAAHCMATIVVVADDSEKITGDARRIPAASRVAVGATCLDQVAVIRILAEDSLQMRAAVGLIVDSLDGTLEFELPRVWHC